MTETYMPKCYAWRPKDSDTICALDEDHPGDHAAQGHTWPRPTAAQVQAAITAIHAANDALATATWDLIRYALNDGRHTLRDTIGRFSEQRQMGVMQLSRTAVEWRRQIEPDTESEEA